jgi:SAM-dependent methyltransferase
MSDPATQAYWDERYQGEGYRFGETPNAFLVAQQARLEPGARALVIADGEGRNGVWLARQGLDVVTTDISPVAVAKARALAAREHVTIDARIADLANWSWPVAAFDVVVAVFIQFAGPPLRDHVFAAMKAALRPGGLLLLQGYRPEQLGFATGGPRDPAAFYTESLLRDVFADFGVLELKAYDAELCEGSAHNGPSAVIDLVARRPS